MSPIVSTPAARARPTTQCGAGCVSGTPGASTRAAIAGQSARCKSTTSNPAFFALAADSALSSQASTLAPPARKACALANPESPRPKMATRLPAKDLTGITLRPSSRLAAALRANSSSQLQCGESSERQHNRNNPETDHNLRLGPAKLLEMMMNGCHAKHPLARKLEGDNLDNDRDSLEHEQPADHRQHHLMFGGDRDRADHAAERKRTRVPHEDGSGRCIEPQKSQSGPDYRSAQDGQFAGAGDVVNIEVLGKKDISRKVRD